MPRLLTSREAREILAYALFGQLFPHDRWTSSTGRQRNVARDVASPILRDLRKLGYDVVPRKRAVKRKAARRG